MTSYSNELKASIVAKMLPPNNVSVPQLVRETGMPRATLYGWRRQTAGQARAKAAAPTPLAGLASAEKVAMVVETASLTELELGA